MAFEKRGFNGSKKKEKNDIVFTKRLKAGNRRTYFFDVKSTKDCSDYFIMITESKKRLDIEYFDRHKIYLYKEDFQKFFEAFSETMQHVKTVLLPDYNFDNTRKDVLNEEELQETVPEFAYPDTSDDDDSWRN